MDSRKEKRLKRRTPCNIYYKHVEYEGEIIDISPSGIAVATYKPLDVLERDVISVTIYDEQVFS